MLFGLDGVEIGLIIVFLCLFGGILSGFPVAFAIGGAGVISFGIIAVLDSAGLLIHQAIDTSSEAYGALVASGVKEEIISVFRYPELPTYGEPVFPRGWETALDRNISFILMLYHQHNIEHNRHTTSKIYLLENILIIVLKI